MSARRPSFDTPRDVPSYDDKQLAAVRTVCTICGRAFYMTTTLASVCSQCQRERWQGWPDDDEEDR